MNVPALPNAVVLKIFSFLTFEEKIKMQRVCKQWQRLSLDGVKEVAFISKSSEYVSVVRMAENAVVVAKWSRISSFLKKWPKIKCVKLYDCDFKDNNVWKVSEAISDVVSLHLFYKNSSLEKIERKKSFVSKLLQHTRSLRSVSFVGEYVSKEVLDEIISRNTHLDTLRIDELPVQPLSSESFPALKSCTVAEGNNSFIDLLRLLVSTSGETLEKLSTPPLKSTAELQLISRFKNLKDLRVQLTRVFHWGELFPFQNLETLQVSVHQFIDLIDIIRKNPKLKVLSLIQEQNLIGDLFLQELARVCLDLEVLIIKGKLRLESETMVCLLNLRKLQHLSLKANIDDTAVSHFINESPVLQVLRYNNDSVPPFDAFVAKAAEEPSKQFFCNFHTWGNMKNIPRNLFLRGKQLKSAHWYHFFGAGFKNFNDDFFAWKSVCNRFY